MPGEAWSSSKGFTMTKPTLTFRQELTQVLEAHFKRNRCGEAVVELARCPRLAAELEMVIGRRSGQYVPSAGPGDSPSVVPYESRGPLHPRFGFPD